MKRVFITLVAILFLISCEEKNESTKPTLENLTESVYGSVTIQPLNMYEVFASAPGIIDKILVEEGDSVVVDQIIAQITSDVTKYNAQNAKLSLELARSKLKGESNELGILEDEIESNENQLRQDSINFKRQMRLNEKSVGTVSELDAAKLKFELAIKKRDILNNQYEQLKEELKNNYKQSQNALSKAKINLNDYSIKSKIVGLVYSITKDIGELITQQEPLAKIGSRDSFLIEIEIDEVDIVSIEVGQSAFISLDAYKGKIFKSTITKVYPIKNTRTQTFKVEAMFTNPPKSLYAGLSGEANIVISQKNNVMTIPKDYLTSDNEVITKDGKKKIKTGVQNLNKVEVISGIDTSVVIIKP